MDKAWARGLEEIVVLDSLDSLDDLVALEELDGLDALEGIDCVIIEPMGLSLTAILSWLAISYFI